MSAQKTFIVDPWKIIENDFSMETNKLRESIFSLANEYMGTRGNFEEGLGEQTATGCYIGGIYNKERIQYLWKRVGFPTFCNTMMHTIDWLATQVEVDGERFNMKDAAFSDYHRELDMQRGIVKRSLVFTTSKGHQTQLVWERFVSHADRHLGAIRLSLTALNHTESIRVTSLLDGTKENCLYSKSIEHTEILDQQCGPDSAVMLKKVRTTGQYILARMQVSASANLEAKADAGATETTCGSVLEWTATSGGTVSIDKIVSLHTSRDVGVPFGLIEKENDSTEVDAEKETKVITDLQALAQEHADGLAETDYNQLLADHEQVLTETWNRLDIEIEGDEESQQGVRYSMFQLFNTYQGHDGLLNIGAKGLTGETYEGHYFWDSEAYCLPFYLLTNPDAALKLLEYRYNTLDGARQKAKDHCHDGAWYPWQTIDGTEDCGVWEYSFGEVHINGIVPFAIGYYTDITQNTDFLYTKGIEILLEMCRFWTTRTSYIPHRQGYGVLKCMGPDEHQQVIDNNYYTNNLVKWTFEYTLKTIAQMKDACPAELERVYAKINFDEAACDKWQTIAEQMLLPYNEELQIRVQDDSFLSLEPFAREEFDRDRDIPIKEKWPIEKLQKYPIIKQPDILLMMFLFRDQFTLDEKRRHYQFYEQQTVHESSLSPSIHSILAAEVGLRNQAYAYYLWSARLDLDNYNRNSWQGLHISSMSGTWMNIVMGFGGLYAGKDHIEFNPALPNGWKSLALKINYRGELMQFRIGSEQLECSLIGEKKNPVQLRILGETVELSADQPEFAKTLTPEPALEPKAVIFDMDGVICDTAEYHYLAWKAIADEEGIYFDRHINERLKGVSRGASLDILLEKGSREYSADEKAAMAEKKNDLYKEFLKQLTPEDSLPGIKEFVFGLKEQGFKLAICSASKNAPAILDYLQAADWFDAVVCGEDPVEPKPHPAGFLLAAERIGIDPANCVVVEDAFAGVQAANAAGMRTIGIGHKLILHNADYTLPATKHLSLERVHLLF